ncbi:hypothetical protein Dimus_031608 [Dionaea muscipula]
MHVETTAGEPLVSPCSTSGLINKVGYAPWSLIEYKSYKDSIHDYFLDVSLCLLMNKLLNLEEGEEHGFNEKDSSLIGSCLLKLSTTDGLNNDVVLPDCRIIEVRQLSFHWRFHPNCFLWLLN